MDESKFLNAFFERRLMCDGHPHVQLDVELLPNRKTQARRLADPELEVTDEDMIMTRTRTTGIIVTEFSDKPYT